MKLMLMKAGELADAQGLAPAQDARIVRAGDSGKPEVTDGPFAEAKEFLAGVWILDVASKDEAYAAAAARTTSIPERNHLVARAARVHDSWPGASDARFV